MIAEIYVGAQIGILLLLGYIARRTKVIGEGFPRELSRFLISFGIPCVVLKALLSENGVSGVQSLILPFVVVAIISVLAALLAFALARLIGKRDGFYRVILATTLFSNFTFMGYPVIEALYGVEGTFYLTIMTIPIRFLLYGTLPLIFSAKHESPAAAWRGFLLSPPILAVFAGLLLAFLKVKVPVPVNSAINGLATASTSMGMMLCGMLVAELPLKTLFGDRRVLLATAARLILMPALALVSLMFIPMPRALFKVGVIFAALPAGSILSAYAARGGVRPAQTSAVIAMTTVCSLITVPFWAWVLTLV